MCRKDLPFGPNLQSEMQQLKRQLDFVNQKYENEKLKRGRYFTHHVHKFYLNGDLGYV